MALGKHTSIGRVRGPLVRAPRARAERVLGLFLWFLLLMTLLRIGWR